MKKFHKPPSLRRALTRQMIWTQTLVLTLFTLLAAVPILNVVSREQGLDAAIIDDIGRSVSQGETGSLEISPNSGLSKVIANYPDFWFYVVDAQGDVAQRGEVPDEIKNIAINLTRISSANISDIGAPDTTLAIIRQYQSGDGHLWIVTAGGPLIGWKMIGVAFANPIFLGLLFLLTSKDEASVGEIAEALRVAPAAVTNLSKRMQGAGLIERVADAADGRLTRLRLTSAGKAASTQSSVVLQSLNGQLTAGFSPEELAVVARWLDHAAKLSGDDLPSV